MQFHRSCAVLSDLPAPSATGQLHSHKGLSVRTTVGYKCAAAASSCCRALQSEPPARIQMSSALVMGLVQAAAELPPADAPPGAAVAAASLPVAWADYLWRSVLTR